MPSAKEVLNRLLDKVAVSTVSNSALVGSVAKAVVAEEKDRRKKYEAMAAEAKTQGRRVGEPPVELRRKQGLRPFPDTELGANVSLQYIQVLHHLARSMALTQRGASRGLAEHWGSLKYLQALEPQKGSLLWLSAEGKRIVRHYKSSQSEELGQAFAVTLAETVLRRRFPGHSISIIHSDTVLRAGWALKNAELEKGQGKDHNVGYRYRPDFLAEIWQPGRPSLVIPLTCRGNHSGRSKSHEQLASSAAYVDGLHIGPAGETPGLLFSMELPLEGPLAVHALHAPGAGGWLDSSGEGAATGIDWDGTPWRKNLFPGIRMPQSGDDEPVPVPGCHIAAADFAFFQRVIAQTGAAGLTAFAGAGRATGRLLTKRQGGEFFSKTFEHPAATSVQDADHDLLGEHFAGTDHIFRLNGDRVEAFTGLQTDLFRCLVKRGSEDEGLPRPEVEKAREVIHARLGASPRTGWDKEWGGPVSVHQDGTVLALRLVKVRKSG
ncbi:hypothetical protein [Streptomyces lichenis]|uniref:Uncharacterized protein n=1 Tax=Streptomyces lichenis TaxID=2306967 RepID=A0ABT0I3Y6_9ACTN|nr:hypothetical protein [Streptomyces lichenis]MCK8676037.1 hypothetical protein [Streptomyces lichenis]